MVDVDKVLNDIKILNDSKSKRKKLEMELNYLEKQDNSELEKNMNALDRNIQIIEDSILSSPYVKAHTDVDEEYKGHMHLVYSYYFFGVKIGEGIEYGDDMGRSSESRTFNVDISELKKISKEVMLEQVKKTVEAELIKTEESIKTKVNEKEKMLEKLESLLIERSLAPWYAIFRKQKMDKLIDECKTSIEKLDNDIDFLNKKKEEIKSKDYIKQELKKLEGFYQNIVAHGDKKKELYKLSVKKKEFDSKISEKEKELRYIKYDEEQIIDSYLKSNDKIVALKKVANDSKVDSETRKTANKLIKLLANQITTKNNKK